MGYCTPSSKLRPRSLLGSFAGLLLLWAADARAEPAPQPLTWSQETAEDAESPELRTLRLAEEELFGAAHRDATDANTGGPLGEGNDATVDAPPAFFERDGERIDLAFLKGLKLPATPVHWDSRVIEFLLFFKDDPRGRDLAAAWIKRRERFGPLVRRVLEEQGLPEDLQYVAMIESGYDPLAHSQADAWGMWQFLEKPAESYGLRIDHWVDERLDPERATRAAARFMRDLHERFGNWELSFAAYNMGYGGLLRAIKKYNSNDYWLLSHLEAGLPFETSLYVAKISAMAIVANNPERFGLDKLTPEPTWQLSKVDVAPGSTLQSIAEAAGIPLARLKQINPHLKQSRVPPGEPAAHVYVPREAMVHFAQEWSQRRDELPVPYVLRLGESIELIAKRTGTTAEELRALNDLDDSNVKPGFVLLVPSRAGEQLAQDAFVCSVPAREASYPDRKQVFYRVGPEDSAAQVARFFGVTQDELMSWNSVAEGAALQAGMLLRLFVAKDRDLSQAVTYTPDEVRVLTVGSDEFYDYHESLRGRLRVRYRVQPGDTLSTLGQRFDLSVGSLGRINQFSNNRELRAGEKIVVYAPQEQLAKLEREGLVERMGGAERPSAMGASSSTATSTSTAAPEAASAAAPEAAAVAPETAAASWGASASTSDPAGASSAATISVPAVVASHAPRGAAGATKLIPGQLGSDEHWGRHDPSDAAAPAPVPQKAAKTPKSSAKNGAKK